MEICSYFVRERNVLLGRAQFSDLIADLILHLGDHGIALKNDHLELFKQALAAFTLHCASRPLREHISWTLNFQRPLVNLFLVADTSEGNVTGRVFTENVKKADQNSFYQEIISGNKPLVQSFVNFTGSDPLLAAEQYYERSEQRPARFFQLGEEDYAIVSAHPDYDEDWFQSLELADVRKLASEEELSLLEKRSYRWHCGCNLEKIYSVMANLIQADLDGVFQNDPTVTVNCPRCAAQYTLERTVIDSL